MQIDAVKYTILRVLSDSTTRDVGLVAKDANLSPDSVRREMTELEANGWIKVERMKDEEWSLTKAGIEAKEKGLPEDMLLEYLLTSPKTLSEIQQHFSTNSQNVSAAMGTVKRKNLISTFNQTSATSLEITDRGREYLKESELLNALKRIASGQEPDVHSPLFVELRLRRLIEPRMVTTELLSITPEGSQIIQIAKPISTTKISQLTPEIIVSGKWKNAEFKPYDVNIPVEETFPGRLHPLTHTIRDVRRIMVELGFKEYSGPLVESVFWNNEVMFFPQDHPSRDAQDTFYIPGKGVIEDAELAKRVKAIHEHGGKTGSRGHGYEWNASIAQQLLLRTHTTAATYREFGKGMISPHKGFSIGRIFRNEAIDATHLAEFHQVEGFVMGEGLTLRHLMGIVKEFYGKLGLKEIRFKPTYNPYTEPSMEASAYNPKLKKWIELINSGMFRPETLAPFGIKVPVIAWGFGLERLAMFLHDKATTKEVIGPEVDLDFIRSYDETIHEWGVE